VFVVVFFVGIAIGILAWPALGRILLAYGLAVRIPIALLMLVAMLGNWGTHYAGDPATARWAPGPAQRRSVSSDAFASWPGGTMDPPRAC
jgi:hypothetical protein